jgi:hypothetical protein
MSASSTFVYTSLSFSWDVWNVRTHFTLAGSKRVRVLLPTLSYDRSVAAISSRQSFGTIGPRVGHDLVSNTQHIRFALSRLFRGKSKCGLDKREEISD